MKPNQLATLVLRLLGVYCIVQSIGGISLLFTAYSYGPGPNLRDERFFSDETRILVASIPVALRLLVGVALLLRAESWGNHLAPKDASQQNLTPMSSDQLQVLAFSVTGIFIFSDALPQLFGSLMNLASIPMSFSSPMSIYSRNGLLGVGSVLKAVLGLWMFLGARSFTNFLNSFQLFGASKPPS